MENNTYENILAVTDAERKVFGDSLPPEPEKTFLLHWIGQDEPEEVKGESIARAFTAAGLGAGAIAALDWYEEIE